VPTCGVFCIDTESFVFADLPGLLEGAHLGKGLGQEFLKHCERCRVLIYVIDGTSKNPLNEFIMINRELELTSTELTDKPQILVYNKMDSTTSYYRYIKICKSFNNKGFVTPIPISAITGRGLSELKTNVYQSLKRIKYNFKPFASKDNYSINSQRVEVIDEFFIELPPERCDYRYFMVTGDGIDKFIQMTEFTNHESVKRLQKVLALTGIITSLKNVGVREGDTVIIGDVKMEWIEIPNINIVNLNFNYIEK
jgi:GTP-binding protein